MKRVGVVLASSLILLLGAAPALAADPAPAPAATPAKAAKAKPAKAAKPAKKQKEGPCYSKPEFDAEQGIRFHTELMVTSLTCQSMAPAGQSLYADYKRVTLTLRDQLVDWEKQLIGYYKKIGTPNPTRAFDNFRTSVANETSQRIAAVTEPIFCQVHVPMIAEALKFTIADVKGRLDDVRVVRIGSAPRCDMPRPQSPYAGAEGDAGAAQLAAAR